VRRVPPRVMRHTAAPWLVQDGVPLYDVQALLGHESGMSRSPRRSGTRTSPRTRTARSSSRGSAVLAHQRRTAPKRPVADDRPNVL
jgi:hypothetical protein